MGFLTGGPERINIQGKDQRRFSKDVTADVHNQWGRSGPVYGERIIPGASQIQDQMFDLTGGFLGNVGGAINRTLSGQPSFTVDPAARQRYYDQAIKAPAMREFDNTLDQIDTRYGNRWTKAGAGGHRGAVNRAAGDLQANLTGQMAGLVREDEVAARAASESAANRQFQAGFQGLDSIAGVGSTQRGIDAQRMGEDYNKWQQGQAYNNPWLNFMPQAFQQRYAVGQSPGLLGSMGGFLEGVGSLGIA